MNKQILTLAGILSLLAANTTMYGWQSNLPTKQVGWRLRVTNGTDTKLIVRASFKGCTDDKEHEIKPDETLYTWAGACLLDSLVVYRFDGLFAHEVAHFTGPFRAAEGRLVGFYIEKTPNGAYKLNGPDVITLK